MSSIKSRRATRIRLMSVALVAALPLVYAAWVARAAAVKRWTGASIANPDPSECLNQSRKGCRITRVLAFA